MLGDNRKKAEHKDLVFVQQQTNTYTDIFGANHDLESYEDSKTVYKLADFNDEDGPWHSPIAYQAIYDTAILTNQASQVQAPSEA